MKKILFIGDGVTPTGFSKVLHNIIRNLPRKKFDSHHLAINYYGDPHEYPWKIYPASIRGDLWGYNRISEFSDMEFDGIFILNDVWVIQKYLEKIKEKFTKKTIPPIIVYFPVDAKNMDLGWFKDFDIVSKTVVYTQFALDEVNKVKNNLGILKIPHGVDTSIFYKMDKPKEEIKKMVFPNRKDFLQSFIVLNANRNQPRKQIDISLEGFKLFAENKPENVKLYCHMGTKDAGYDILRLAYELGIDRKLIITNNNRNTQRIPEERLNVIYNATEVGINTSTGEGWGLVSHEHAVTGAPQIVPDHSACKELFNTCGLLMPISLPTRNVETLTKGGLVSAESVAEKLELIYKDKELYADLSKKGIEKFTADEYKWENIVSKQWLPLFEDTFN